jgi:NAD(P)-dependent dehydrogenase (short-subunit alcohol dehydrogenase family)/acyl carrier protein
VITGGLGRIGLELAQHLSREYHAKLLLISRSGMPDPQSWPAILDGTAEHAVMQSKIRALHDITAAGGQFLIAAADVTDEHDVRSAIANAERQFGPINGAFHLAGLLDDASARTAILKLTRGDFIAQAKAKLAGFWVLDRVLGQKRLDFGVLFGSIAAVLGGVGFGAYASINACFDAVAARRDDPAGVPWICCAWDEWRESESDFSSPLALTMAEGVRSLWRALGSAPSSSVVISKSSVAKRFDALRRDRLARPQRAVHPAAAPSAVCAVAPRPDDPDASPPLNDIQRVLAEIWASSLGVDQVGLNDDFFALGGDSMIMLDMLARIEDTFHVEVPLRSFVQSELTVAALARAVERLAEPSSTT